MRYVTDSHGKKILVSYFGDLKAKHDVCVGYVEMYNSMAAEQEKPQINLERALARIKKQHDKFYGYTSKYDGKGCLRE